MTFGLANHIIRLKCQSVLSLSYFLGISCNTILRHSERKTCKSIFEHDTLQEIVFEILVLVTDIIYQSRPSIKTCHVVECYVYQRQLGGESENRDIVRDARIVSDVLVR